MKNIPATVYDFWRNVQVDKPNDPNSCWIWKGPVHANGYGIYRSIYALQAAAIIYTGHICNRVRRPQMDTALGKQLAENGVCFNRLCVRKDHFPLPSKKIAPEGRLSVAREMATIKAVLAARGSGNYKIEDIAHKLMISPKTVKRVLLQAPLYDLEKDVQNYINNGMEVPICPDKRKLERVS